MRSREATAPLDDASLDPTFDVIPSDEPALHEPDVGQAVVRGRVCLSCGTANGAHESCDHPEVARLDDPSRATRNAIARLRRAATEHRAAARAVHALVASEAARGRAEFEVVPVPAPEPAPCARCAERAAAGGLPLRATPASPRRKSRDHPAQRCFSFATDAREGPAA
jgi:hypothetical protein